MSKHTIQAEDRCHRIGQTRPVTVYKLVSASTVCVYVCVCGTGCERVPLVVNSMLVSVSTVFAHKSERENVSRVTIYKCGSTSTVCIYVHVCRMGCV